MANRGRLGEFYERAKTRTAAPADPQPQVVDLLEAGGFNALEPRLALELVYQVTFGHGPDSGAFEIMLPQLEAGHMTNHDLLGIARTWPEAWNQPSYPEGQAHLSIHNSRREWIRMLPEAKRIVDLGGVDLGNPQGALVALGYPYRFERLQIIDLPTELRHPDYRSPEIEGVVDTPNGPVSYLYRSMTDLDGIEDATIDLVYSGQSFEHVTPEDGRKVLAETMRVLRPGGHIAIDTPNGALTRLQQDEFIDADHEVEYTLTELLAVIAESGLETTGVYGLNYAGQSSLSRKFDMAEVAANGGIYSAAADCYILAVLARKPL